jgi:hypothetical protein
VVTNAAGSGGSIAGRGRKALERTRPRKPANQPVAERSSSKSSAPSGASIDQMITALDAWKPPSASDIIQGSSRISPSWVLR